MQRVEKMFAFSFGGDDFGKICRVYKGAIFPIDFTSKPVGIGFAIRDGVDADFGSIKRIQMSIVSSSSESIYATVEFKTEKSNGSPEDSKDIIILGERVPNNFDIEIPKLRSDLKEIVIFIPRNMNDGPDINLIKFESIGLL